MKKCNDCNVEMINSEIHTDYCGGHTFDTQIRVSIPNGFDKRKSIFGKEMEIENYINEQVKARVCPKCGKVELYIDSKHK